MSSTELQSGSLLKHGEYRIERTLGQGGFGITYEAEQVLLRRKVAVKEFFMKDSCERDANTSLVTVPTASNRELVSKFKNKFIREARMIAGLDHEHIVKIHDVFEENGTAYYVMEHIGGACLGDIIKSGKALNEQLALDYIHQIGLALSYIHNKGIIHFDVKPSNVLITEDGVLKLIDFGISKHYDEAGIQTSTTPVGISKGYAPLEQYLQGSDINSFTPATDIYSLGATLYALLSGLNPPEASVVNEEGVPMIHGVSPVVMNAIEQAMRPRRKERPQSVSEFMALLDAVLEGNVNVGVEDSEKTVRIATDEAQHSSEPVSVPVSRPCHIFLSKLSVTWLFGLLAGVAVAMLVIWLRTSYKSSASGNSANVSAELVNTATSDTLFTIAKPAACEGVDLGLSVKWATCNVGAANPEDYGAYFAWGETNCKNDYSWSSLQYRIEGDSYENVKFSKYVAGEDCGQVDYIFVLEREDDAASVNWGGDWRMPTEAEFKELMNKCTWVWTSMNGVSGYRITSAFNGNSIFLPATGYSNAKSVNYAGREGYYWTASLSESYSYSARYVYLSQKAFRIGRYRRNYGQAVRPVCSTEVK